MRKFNKIFIWLAFFGLSIGMTSAQVVGSGSCGPNLTWTLTGVSPNLTLTISGTGGMSDYYSGTLPVSTPWYSQRANIKKLVIQEGVTAISNYAFYDCSNLNNLVIEDGSGVITFYYGVGSVQSTYPNYTDMAYHSAFTNAPLDTIYMGKGIAYYNNTVQSQSWGNPISYASCSPFRNKTTIKHLTIGNEVTAITGGSLGHGMEATFLGCTGLTTLNFNATNCTIADYNNNIHFSIFNGCTSLTTLNIGENVTNIPDYAFAFCSSLTSALTIPNSVTSIGNSAFYYCSGLTGNLTIPNSVTTIGNNVFENCSGLTGTLTIGNSITSIGNNVFRNCSGLTGALTIPNSVTSIGNNAFYYCSGLTGNLTIPNSVMSIGDYAFHVCSGLTGVLTIPDSVTSIGEGAFSSCSGLTEINIPNSVTSIGDYAFNGCSSLTSINVDANNQNYSSIDGIMYDKAQTQFIHIPASIQGAVNIPNTIISIPNNAFYNRIGLTSITIPNSVASIGDYAFYNCIGLTSITIPNSVTSIGNFAFGECTGFSTINFNATNCTTMGSSSYYTVFSGCTSLATLNIGENVVSIPAYAFYGYSGLTGTLTIPNSVTSIGLSAFQGCSGLSGELTIPNLITSIDAYAFRNCSGFSTLNFNATNCYTMGGGSTLNAFDGTYFSTLNIGDNVTIIPNYAFEGCRFTNELIIPNSVTTIGNGAFANCRFTGALIIPNFVTTIGNSAFWGCSYLTSVTIPNSVVTIGNYAFYDCNNLTSVINNRTAPQNISADVFSSTAYTNAALYVPQVSFTAYLTSTGWQNFNNIQPMNGVTGVSLNTNSLTLNTGETANLTATISPSNATNQGVIWSSSNNSVAAVSNGVVTAVSGGSAIITATTSEGGFSASCAVQVNNVMRDISAWAMPANAGVITGSGSFPQGSTHTVTAAANAGYTFVNWLENGAVVSTNASYTFTITGNRTLVAVFVETDIDLSDIEVDSETGITIIPDSVSALVVWNTNENATGYTLVIYADAAQTEIICSLEFNANGYLTSIMFHAPARQPAQSASGQDVIGIRIVSLSENTTYYYQLQTLGESGIIDAKEGEFTTTGGENSIASTSLSDQISIYPNPTNYELKITNYEGKINSVEICDIAGRIVLIPQLSFLNSINVAHLPKGVYLVKIHTDKGIVTQKVVKN